MYMASITYGKSVLLRNKHSFLIIPLRSPIRGNTQLSSLTKLIFESRQAIPIETLE